MRSFRRLLFVPSALFLGTLMLTDAVAAPPDAGQTSAKARIVVMTDIGGDPDDRQSMVRFLLYACDFDVEGLCTGFGHGHYQVTHPELIRDAVDAYGKVLPNLKKHRSGYPSHEKLLGLIKDGHNGDPHRVGPGMDSEASDWIIRVLDRDDPRPVWFSIWGGPRELAQAIWRVSQTRSPTEIARFKSKIRVHSIADQDRTAGWVKQHHPDVFWIYSNRLFRGIWQEGNQAIVSPEWLQKHVLRDHGPLGLLYPPKASGKDGVKEGDTPSFLYLLPNGLSDPEHPEWGNWGGRFRPSGFAREFIPAEDLRDNRPDLLYSIRRWREAYQNAFEARMDWCVQSYAEANHEPTAVCNADQTLNVLKIETDPGARVKLRAAGSTDPDGDVLDYRWWVYREAGSYWAKAPIRGADKVEAVVTVPQEASGRSIHVILEVADTGKPRLVTYRRVILNVSGEPIEPPAGTIGAEEDWTTPVTRLEGPPEKDGPWEFWRGINVNGPAINIDGNPWQGDAAPDFICKDKPLSSPQVVLRPPTDANRAKMIHSFRWNREARLQLLRVPDGVYAVYAYLWEETDPETFRIYLNGRMVERDYYSGPAGRWRRLGPWITEVDGGSLIITSERGAANFSGIEVWKRIRKPQ